MSDRKMEGMATS